MRIAIFSTNYEGGAAIAARRLHDGLRQIGQDSVFINRDVTSQQEQAEQLKTSRLATWRKIFSKLRRRIPITPSYSWDYYHHLKYSASCELFSDFRSDVFRNGGYRLPDASIVNLHWVSFFLDLPSVFREYAGKTPIVWTLHDMNALTGGCHYDNFCGRFRTTCSNCPQLASPGMNDASNAIHVNKKQFFDKLSPAALTLIAPSKWLAEQIAASPILSRFRNYVIPYGIDTDAFCPSPQRMTSQIIPRPNILFIASDLSNPRKGFSILQSALRDLDNAGISFTLQTVGRSIADQQDYKNITVINNGFVKDSSDLAKIYSQSDALVLPSIQDNLPNTILEAIACGTPVIANPIGGIPDAVRPNQTGWLTKNSSAQSLASTIQQALTDISHGLSLRTCCRRVALEEYSLTVQATRYMDLYSTLLTTPFTKLT
jgi:glycosyltransferase involved in cell wall biosynthesis